MVHNKQWNVSDIIKLALCWALTLSTSTFLTDVGPLSALSIGASGSNASLTISIFLIGAAASSVTSGRLFHRFGRFGGFSIGCCCQLFGCILCAFAISCSSEVCLYSGCLFIGVGQGVGQFYRFAAIDVSTAEFKNSAITYVLSGGVLAAFLGPTSATYTKNLIGASYVGCYLMMGVYTVVNQAILYTIAFPSHIKTQAIDTADSDGNKSECERIEEYKRPMLEIITQPLFILSCTTATVANTVMVMFMSEFSLSMDAYNFSMFSISLVLELHLLAMFLPGFFTGSFISYFGSFTVSIFGTCIFAIAVVMFASGYLFWNYSVGMVLIGVAWNFSFSSGTVMLTSCYQASEALDVQAVFDFFLFTISGLGSLSAGTVYAHFGWHVLTYVTVVMMGINVLLFCIMRNIRDIKELEFHQEDIPEESRISPTKVRETQYGSFTELSPSGNDYSRLDSIESPVSRSSVVSETSSVPSNVDQVCKMVF